MDTVITKPYKVADLVDKIRDTYPDEESFDTSINSTEAGADTSYRASHAKTNGDKNGNNKEMSHTFRDGVTVEVVAAGSAFRALRTDGPQALGARAQVGLP